eukprot:m.11976 g.11976  ORF g.11976 m.11976 type:complete len:304 (+) comp7599_c0_seq1:278-1189(+)
MEVLKILCVGSSGSSKKERIIDSFRENKPSEKDTSNTEPVKITAVVRGIPRHVIICDYNSKASVEENYINTDIVLIFANANLETESWPEAVQNGFSSRDRAYSWLEEVRVRLPHVPFMFVLTDTDARPKGARRRDRDWVTKNMLKSKALRRGAIATVELRTNHASLEGEIIKQYEELFQLAVVKALEPGVVHIRSCSCMLCCGCRSWPTSWCIDWCGLSCATCLWPGYPGGYECLRCIPCCRTFTYQAGREISPSQLRRAKMTQEDSIGLRKTPCVMWCPFVCCGEFTDYDVGDEFGGRSAFF